MSNTWQKQLVLFLLWSVVFIVALGAVAEWYLSKQGYTVDRGFSSKDSDMYDSYLGWRTPPGANVPRSDPAEYQVVENVWPDTARVSRPIRNKKASKHVLLVGCSHTYGLMVSDETTFAWQLNERFPDIAFDNFGVNGYGTYNSYLREKQQLYLHPHRYDLVLYSAFLEHLFRNVEWKAFGRISSTHSYYMGPRVDYSDRGELLFFSGERRWPGDDLLVSLNFAKRVYYYWLIRECRTRLGEYDATQHCLFWELNRRMAELAKSYGAKYGLVWLFDKHTWDYMLNQRSYWHANYPWPQNPGLWGKTPEYPCLCIDISQETLQSNHLPGDLGHYNRYIHSIWAKNIGDWVEKLLNE